MKKKLDFFFISLIASLRWGRSFHIPLYMVAYFSIYHILYGFRIGTAPLFFVENCIKKVHFLLQIK